MVNQQKLRMVKILHTIIWWVMVAAILQILYAGLTGHISTWTFLALGLLALEVITLLINRWTCPLTPIARQYSDNPKANFDIYLPEWLAQYNKQIFGTLLVAGLLLLAWRWATPI